MEAVDGGILQRVVRKQEANPWFWVGGEGSKALDAREQCVALIPQNRDWCEEKEKLLAWSSVRTPSADWQCKIVRVQIDLYPKSALGSHRILNGR